MGTRQLNIGKGNPLKVFTLIQLGVGVQVGVDVLNRRRNKLAVTTDHSTYSLHHIIIVVLSLPAENSWQRLGRVDVPGAQNVGLSPSRHSEKKRKY